MYSESFAKRLRYKFRELELILRNLETQSVPDRIDIDLALSKTRELYDILLRQTSAPSPEPEAEKIASAGTKPVVPSDPEPFEEEKEFEQEGIIPDPVHKEPEPKEEKEFEQEGIIPDPVHKEPEKKEEKDEPVNPNGQKDIEIVADRFQTSQNYLNKAMADKKTGTDITSKMQSRPISDLRNSIGLNEKFLFIKELFKGRPDQYNQCIDNLNQTATFEEAVKFLKENYDWEEGNKVAEKLISLVKRKHPTG